MHRKLAASLALTASLALGGVISLAPRPAAAFCGFYVAGADAKLFNNATVVVLMRDGTRTVLSMQNDYQGPPEDFALIIPVPVVLQEGEVKTLRKELFGRVETLASPRLVEYWEMDPCQEGIGLGNFGAIGRGGGGTGSGYGSGGGMFPSVTIEAEFAVAEYDIVILSATESNGLDGWLRAGGYNIPEGAEPLLRPYVEQGMKFFVAKVDPSKVEFDDEGHAMLSPLRFHYDSEEFALPVRLGLINAPDPASGGKQDLLVHILAPGDRYQVANYPNVTIPTNLDLREAAKEGFGEFYVSLFDHTLAEHPTAVVTEYAWGASSCDPCPGPEAALTNQELLELGGDVLPNWSEALSSGGSGGGPRVRQGKAKVVGQLDQDIIRRIVRAHINEVRACYNAGLSKNPALLGQVTIDFVIGSTGNVESAAVSDASTLRDDGLGQCIAKAVRRWKFPKARDGGKVEVSYPFNLSGGAGGFRGSAAGSFVLTRLHARYDSSALAEDLVFEAAGPIVGGREFYVDDGQLEQSAVPSEFGINNFQARYAIRHEWQGKLDCEAPTRGRWGGPPEGAAPAMPTVARELARATRGSKLASFVTISGGQQLGIARLASPENASQEPEPEPKLEPDQVAPAQQPGSPKSAGCSCSMDSEPQAPIGAALGLLMLVGIRRRFLSSEKVLAALDQGRR